MALNVDDLMFVYLQEQLFFFFFIHSFPPSIPTQGVPGLSVDIVRNALVQKRCWFASGVCLQRTEALSAVMTTVFRTVTVLAWSPSLAIVLLVSSINSLGGRWATQYTVSLWKVFNSRE